MALGGKRRRTNSEYENIYSILYDLILTGKKEDKAVTVLRLFKAFNYLQSGTGPLQVTLLVFDKTAK